MELRNTIHRFGRCSLSYWAQLVATLKDNACYAVVVPAPSSNLPLPIGPSALGFVCLSGPERCVGVVCVLQRHKGEIMDEKVITKTEVRTDNNISNGDAVLVELLFKILPASC